MQIGIIGFSGFIGNGIVTTCNSDPRVDRVVLVGRNELDSLEIDCDLNSALRLDVIVNCAEVSPTTYSEKSTYLKEALHLNSKIIKFIERCTGKPFIINLNSLWAYPESVTAIKEDSFWSGCMNPDILWYSCPKRMLILQLESLANENYIEVSNVTLGNVFGPNDKSNRVIPKVMKLISEGHSSIELSGTGSEMRDFIPLEVQIHRINECIHAGPEKIGRFLHAGGGSPLSVKEVLICIAEAARFTGDFKFSGNQGLVISPTKDRVMDMTLADSIFAWNPKDRKSQFLNFLHQAAEDYIFEN
jgi:nucleoside-diphosphate-sugar epimerase